MTSAEREAIIVRAVEGGLLDEVINSISDEPEGPPDKNVGHVVRAMREKFAEILGERPRQTRRLIKAAVAVIWKRQGLGDPATVLEEREWKIVYDALEGKR